MLGNGARQNAVVGAFVGKDDVQHLLARSGLGQLLDELCLGGAGPGPGAEFG